MKASTPRQAKSQDDSKRAERLRENKRRNRQRKKDYTASLEARLLDLEAKGIQATQEVQVSARKVVEENARLKALLRHLGVCNRTIDSWKPGQEYQPTLGCAKKNQNQTETFTYSPPLPLPHIPSPSLFPPPQPLPTLKQSSSNNSSLTSSTSPNTTPPKPPTQIPPCKILTRQLQDPTQDITQPIPNTDPSTEQHEAGGVECSKAHEMLMKYATTEENLEIVSQALERGCVGKNGGGCKVRNEILWKAMDEVI